MKKLLFVFLAAVLASTVVNAGDAITPGPRDKCPVCGMFVAKYREWISVIVFTDGTRAHFDGPKDMFKYYLDMKRFAPGKDASHVARMLVTDYYSLSLIDAFAARYVVGSDVYGPMGRELVPFVDEKGAGEFLRDHRGKRVIRFRDVEISLLKGLEQ